MNRMSKPRIFAVLILTFIALALSLSSCKDFSFFSELGIKGGLSINPSEITVAVNSSVTFTAAGGNPPYTYGLVSGTGSIDAATGAYTAPAAASNDIVVVTDSTGQSGTAAVTVAPNLEALKISPTTASVSVGNSISFVPTGGVSPYTFDFQTNNSGGNVTPGGVYTAGSTTGVSDTIIVTDSDTPPQTCSVPAVVSVTGAVTNIDHSIPGETFPPSAIVGSSISGDFTIHNGGSATGTASISWWLFISEDGTFGGDGEHLVASGIVTDDILASGDYVVAPTGNWPSDLPQGNYDLFVMVSSPDDLDHGNNVSTASAFTLNVPDVDYRVLSVTNLGETHVGGSISGEFTLDNEGTDDGTQTVTWKAYVSANTTVDVGDTLIDSNTEGAMTSAEVPRTVSFSGTWPSSPGSYYLVVEVIAGDDAAAGNDGDNTTATGSALSVAYPEVDYYADAISSTGGVAGDTLSCSFDLNNAGSDASAMAVTWNLYVSANSTLDAGDYLATSGSAGPLGAGPSSTMINPSGATWPITPGDYYLIVEIESYEDLAAGNAGNDVAVSGSTLTVAAPRVDYIVDQVNFVAAGSTYLPDGTVNGNFTYKNNGTNNGTQPVSWEAYASLDEFLDAGDVLIESGSGLLPLGIGLTSGSIGFSGIWPLDYGKYFLVVRVMSSDEFNPADNVGATGATESVGYFDETGVNEPNNDYIGLTDFYDLGVTFKPGMSIEITGTMSAGDMDDIMAFNTGSCSMITFAVTYGSADAQIRILLLDGPNSFIDGVSGTPGGISLNWTVDAAGAQRYLNLDNRGEELSGPPPILPWDGPYTCVITGH